MPIGDYYSIIAKNAISKLIYKFLGILDLHSHIRLKPVVKYLKRYLNENSLDYINIFEPGCGSGINGFESYKIAMEKGIRINYVGVDASFEAIYTANLLLKYLPIKNAEMSFFCSDAVSFLEKQRDFKFDIVLLIDIIEHVENPLNLLELCSKYLKKNGIFIVSVPTPLYPKFFGEEFAKNIGHLVDGYSVESLDDLFSKVGCVRLEFKYNTGLISNVGCWLYYKKFPSRNKYFNLLKFLFLYPFKFLDFFNNSRISCSLFAVYKKEY